MGIKTTNSGYGKIVLTLGGALKHEPTYKVQESEVCHVNSPGVQVG